MYLQLVLLLLCDRSASLEPSLKVIISQLQGARLDQCVVDVISVFIEVSFPGESFAPLHCSSCSRRNPSNPNAKSIEANKPRQPHSKPHSNSRLVSQRGNALWPVVLQAHCPLFPWHRWLALEIYTCAVGLGRLLLLCVLLHPD